MSESEELDIILSNCLKGREDAFEKLYYRFYGFLFSVARRYARDAEEAKDMVQNSFVRISKNLDKYSGVGSFKSWIKKITINESINHFNRVNKGNKMFYNEDMTYYESKESLVVSEETVLSKLTYDDLNNFVLELPPAYKAVFTLYVIDGYKHNEIAEMLGIGESTSKSNLSRAKNLLVQRLSEAGIALKKRVIENV